MAKFLKSLGEFFLVMFVGFGLLFVFAIRSIIELPFALLRLFRKLPDVPTEKDIEWFWNIITASNSNRETLYNILLKQKKFEIMKFHHCFEYITGTIRRHPYVTTQDEDEIDDICHWVISQGKGSYQIILDNPEMMPRSVRGNGDKILYGVADRLFYKKYNKPIITR